ncbi:unnamed protein product [Vicia faba]|uniref:Uncharacterized protein n=1 Tax=Vicia faba TaxID=3906 RepID=A0AAV0ZUR2_VICFA|nr:unnamed protein product [Vicia faba]
MQGLFFVFFGLLLEEKITPKCSRDLIYDTTTPMIEGEDTSTQAAKAVWFQIDSLRTSSLAGDLANFVFPEQDSCHQGAPLERGPSETHAIKKKSLELNH